MEKCGENDIKGKLKRTTAFEKVQSDFKENFFARKRRRKSYSIVY